MRKNHSKIVCIKLGHLKSCDCQVLPSACECSFFLWHDISQWARASSLSRLRDHTQIHPSRQDFSGRVISPKQRTLPDNIQHSQERETSISTAGLEPATSASERPQTHALASAITGISERRFTSNGGGGIDFFFLRGASRRKVTTKTMRNSEDGSWSNKM